MDNPLRPSDTGAARQPWSQSPKQKRSTDKNGNPVLYGSPPDPSTYYYQMSGPYEQNLDSHPYGAQPAQAHHNYPQNRTGVPSAPSIQPANPNNNCPQYALGATSGPSNRPTNLPQPYPQYGGPGPSAPSYRPASPPQLYPQYGGPGLPGLSYRPTDPNSYRPTDPNSYPQYPGFRPLAPYQRNGPEQHQPQPRAPGPLPPTYAAPVGAAEPASHYIRAVQTGPGQYQPGGQGLAGNSSPIEAKQEEDPFNMTGRKRPYDVTASEDRAFLKSKFLSHETHCNIEPGIGEEEEQDDHCLRNGSESPSVLKKNRDDGALARHVRELKGQLADLKESLKEEHEKEIAKLKKKAVEAVGDAAVELCEIRRGSQLWQLLVQEVKDKIDEMSTDEDEDEVK